MTVGCVHLPHRQSEGVESFEVTTLDNPRGVACAF